MTWGIVSLFCPVCGVRFRLNAPGCFAPYQKTFGYCCSRECFTAAEMKYARMILGKDDEVPSNVERGTSKAGPDRPK